MSKVNLFKVTTLNILFYRSQITALKITYYNEENTIFKGHLIYLPMFYKYISNWLKTVAEGKDVQRKAWVSWNLTSVALQKIGMLNTTPLRSHVSTKKYHKSLSI